MTMNTLKKWGTGLRQLLLSPYFQSIKNSALKSGSEESRNENYKRSKGVKEMDTRSIYQAELRRAVRNIGLKYASAQNKAHLQEDPFALYHFGRALAYEEAIEIIKEVFRDEIAEDDWD